jgi:hypothetical protein
MNVEKALKAYFTDYKSRLSKTSARRLAELAGRKDLSPAYLAGYARNDSALTTRALWKASCRLYEKFPNREDITQTEFIQLVQKYC